MDALEGDAAPMVFRGLRTCEANDVPSVLTNMPSIVLLGCFCTCSRAPWHESVAEFLDSLDQCLVEIGMGVGCEFNAVDLVAQLGEVLFFLHQREDYARVLRKRYQAYPVLPFQPCVEDLLENFLNWP